MPYITTIMGTMLGRGLPRTTALLPYDPADLIFVQNIQFINKILQKQIELIKNNPKLTRMSSSQQFQLKLAVNHHPSLKTQQLVQFLQNQSNQFLRNDFPKSLTQDKFITIFQQLAQTPSSSSQDQVDFSEYVGLLLLYSSSSMDSFQYVKKNVPRLEALNDLFMIIVEMDNTDKKTNAIGDEGERLCRKQGYQFVSQDLVTCLHKNLYQMIENYYYPNQQQKPSKRGQQPQYLFHYNPNTQPPKPNHQSSTASQQINSPISLDKNKNNQNSINEQQKQNKPDQKSRSISKQEQMQRQRAKILATRQEKKSLQKLYEKASELRESRNKEIMQEQKQIDQSIANVQNVLRKINENINSKVKSQWYTSLNHTLYSPLQKNSVSFAKIKLTQQFVDQSDEDLQPDLIKVSKTRSKLMSVLTSSRIPAKPQKSALVNKFIAKHRKLQPIMKILLTVSDSVIVELDVYEQSDYHELTMLGIKKLGITQSQHNYNLMKKIIKQRIQNFIKQLSRAVKNTQKSRLDQRSFIKTNSHNSSLNNASFHSNFSNNNNNKSLYKSNVSGYSGIKDE